ncbi:MAG TPA: hypothetical protein VIH37_00535, partial [Candidatus Limnocylindrales bacterium]
GVRLLAELGRCHLMAGSPELAAPVIEEALTLAERQGRRDVIAELIASKGWAIATLGRSVEAGALLRGGIVFAEREGHLRAEFRCRMNFSALVSYEDPLESLAVARSGYQRARQLGFETWAASLASNALTSAFDMGEWPWVEQTSVGLDPDSADAWRAQVLLPMALIHAHRGQFREAEELLAVFDRAAREATEDLQILATGANARTELALAQGDIAEAVAQTTIAAVGREVLGREEVVLVTVVALRARNAGLADRVADLPHGRLGAASSDAAKAAAAAIRGDRDALTALDRAVDRIEALGVRFSAARLRYARALLEPDDPGASHAAAAAAAVFRELGEVRLLHELRPLLPEAPETAEATV